MIEWAITSSVLILMVLALRRILMGRISLRLQYGLWALVLVRLLLPISLGGTSVSILNPVERTQAQLPNPVVGYLGGDTPQLSVVEPNPSPTVDEQQGHYVQNRDQWQAEMDAARAETGTPISLGTVLLGIWSVGAVSMGLWLLWVNLRFARTLRRNRVPLSVEHCPRPVYVTGASQTPCLFGLVRPCIYVTEEVAANETVLRHSLAHELTHFRHGDHIWAALRGLCLAFHWYNPLVWLAAILSRRDGELCCDEATVKKLGERERAAYGRTLLAVTCQGRTNPMLTATSMTGSGSGIKERILLLTKRPKTAVYTLVAVALISALAVGCTFTGARKDGESTGVSTGDEFVPDKVAMVQLLSSAWPPDPVTDPETVTHLWDLYQDFTFEGTADDLTQNNLWNISVTFSKEGTDQEESFTIYQGGLCTLGENYEKIYRLKNGDELYQEFYTVFQRQTESSTGVDDPEGGVTLTGLAVEASGSEEEIGRQWAETYAAQYRSLSPDNPLYSTDSAVLECTPYAKSLLSKPREQIYLMRFACQAVDKAGFEQWYTGAAGPLTGEEYPQYEGWMEFGWFIVLEEQQKERWVCVNAGTGGYGNWGYLNYETGEIWEQILEEQLSADIDQADPEMVLCILPVVDWSRLDGDELNRLLEILDRACITQGRVYGPEEDRMWSDVYPDDQAYRDLYVMLAALNTDGAYAEGMEGLLEKQQAYDPQVFESCLQNLTPEQQDVIRMLAGM